MGQFYGYRLYILMSQLDEIVCSALSNVYIAFIKLVEKLVKKMKANLYGDRGYIDQEFRLD